MAAYVLRPSRTVAEPTEDLSVLCESILRHNAGFVYVQSQNNQNGQVVCHETTTISWRPLQKRLRRSNQYARCPNGWFKEEQVVSVC